MKGFVVALTLCVAFLPLLASARLREGDCEVCLGVLGKIDNTLTSRKPEDIETAIKDYCKTAEDKENRFCYYVGGTPDAATYILKEISGPMSGNVPATVICERLKKKDAQICELTYPKNEEIDWNTVDLNKLRVKQLKKIVADLKGSCAGCTEKSEFIAEIKRLRSKDEL